MGIISTNPTYTFTADSDLHLTAVFEKVPVYNVTVIVDPSGSGTVIGAGEYKEGESVTVTATADEGYNFSNWTVDGVEVGTGKTYTFTVTGDVEITAIFKVKKPSRLPDGYDEVEYIHLDNNCAFLTSLKLNYSTTIISMDIMPENYVSGSENFIAMNGTLSDYSDYVRILRSSQTQFRYRSYGDKTIKNIDADYSMQRITVEYNGPSKKIVIGNSTGSISTVNKLSPYNFTFFNTLNDAKSPKSFWYGAKVITGGTVVSEYVPCVNSVGKAGMYDIVRNQFFENAKSGSVTAGPAV